MGIGNDTKLNQLLTGWADGVVHTTPWLHANGFTDPNLQKYRTGNWIESLGSGAYKKSNDRVTWQGGLRAMQDELKLRVHVGGKSALILSGQAHYLPFGTDHTYYLLGSHRGSLPLWFRKAPWAKQFIYKRKNLFAETAADFGAKEFGFTTRQEGAVSYVLSARERALFEYLDEMPETTGYDEATEIFEAMVTLRSGLVQHLLETCTSIKVKRLFLHFADRFQHPWFKKLDLKKVDLGTGKRVVFKNGMLDPKYLVTVPRVENDQTV